MSVPPPKYDSLIDYGDLGPLVPEAIAAEVIKTLPQSSAALALCRTTRMSTKTLTQPVLAALPMAYWVQGSTGLKQTTEAAWDGVQLVAEELAAIVPVPEVVIDDAGFPIWSEIRPLLAEAIGLKLDQAVFSGEDSPITWPDGLIQQCVAAGNTNTGDTPPEGGGIANDLLETWEDVEDDGYDVTGIAADRGIRAGLRKSRDTSGQKLLDVSTGEIEGVPVNYVGYGVFPPGFRAVAGDYNMAIVGIRQDITWKMLDQAVISDAAGVVLLNLAQQDAVALRVTARFGFAVANPVTRSAEATPFPFAVLQDVGAVLPAGASAEGGSRRTAKKEAE